MKTFSDVPFEPDCLGFCPECKEEMYWGDLVYWYDDDHFCRAICLAQYVGARLVRGGENEVI